MLNRLVNWLKNHWVFILCLLLVVFAPRVFSWDAVWFSLNNESTAWIGDSIGGMTAPIIGLLSVYLLVETFNEQRKVSKNQLNQEKEAQFINTFFHLLAEQSEMRKEMVVGKQSLFQTLRDKLERIYILLENWEDIQKYSLDDIEKELDEYQNRWEESYGQDFKSKKMVDKLFTLKQLVKENLRLNIDRAFMEEYKNASMPVKLKMMYGVFFQENEFLGNYMRHLYWIMKFAKLSEDDKCGMTHDKVYNYAQLIQASMSPHEMTLVFYNSFMFPKAQELLVKYDLLENLGPKHLFAKEHDGITKIKLKK